MKLIACVDKSMGMLFNKRRQSKDSRVVERILSLIGDRKLYLNDYSSKLFENTDRLEISEDFFSLASDEDFCFCENADIPYDRVKELYLFHWNRAYPGDRFFTMDMKDFKKIKTEELQGSSHKKITLEIYKKEL